MVILPGRGLGPCHFFVDDKYDNPTSLRREVIRSSKPWWNSGTLLASKDGRVAPLVFTLKDEILGPGYAFRVEANYQIDPLH
jgi:hypothetical protein